jgi:hypothetical protein
MSKTKTDNPAKEQALDRLGSSLDALSSKATGQADKVLKGGARLVEGASKPTVLAGALLGVFGMGMLMYARRTRKPRRTEIIIRKGGKQSDPMVELLAEAGKLALRKALK